MVCLVGSLLLSTSIGRIPLEEWSSPCRQQKSLNAVATATAKSLQSCPTLCDPIDGSPPGSPVPGIFQTRTMEWVAIALNAVLGCNLKNDRMTSLCFQGKPLSITVIQVYAQPSNAEEAENLQDLLELTPQKDVLFIIGDWKQK